MTLETTRCGKMCGKGQERNLDLYMYGIVWKLYC